jgi:hypothetical protein
MKRTRDTEETVIVPEIRDDVIAHETNKSDEIIPVKRRRITPNTDDINVINNSKFDELDEDDIAKFDECKYRMTELIADSFYNIIYESDIYKQNVNAFTVNYISNARGEILFDQFVGQIKDYDHFDGECDDFLYENTEFGKVMQIVDYIYDEFFYENTAIDSKFFSSLNITVVKIMENMFDKMDESHTGLNKILMFSVENICDMLTTAFVLAYKYSEDCVFKNDMHIPHINKCRDTADLGHITTTNLMEREFAMLRTINFSIVL